MQTHPNHKIEEGGGNAVPAGGGAAPGATSNFHLKQILVPVDFSTCSIKALQYATHFARQFGSELTLLHVVPPVVVLPTSETMTQGVVEPASEIESGLHELQHKIAAGTASKTVVRYGSPHVEIIDAAKELEIDLIIMSTHGRTGLRHVLLGNTVEKILRRAGCPVLIVREHEHEFINVTEPSV